MSSKPATASVLLFEAIPEVAGEGWVVHAPKAMADAWIKAGRGRPATGHEVELVQPRHFRDLVAESESAAAAKAAAGPGPAPAGEGVAAEPAAADGAETSAVPAETAPAETV